MGFTGPGGSIGFIGSGGFIGFIGSGGSMRDCAALAQTTTHSICLSDSRTTLGSGSGLEAGVVTSIEKVLRCTVESTECLEGALSDCSSPPISGAHIQRQRPRWRRKDPQTNFHRGICIKFCSSSVRSSAQNCATSVSDVARSGGLEQSDRDRLFGGFRSKKCQFRGT